MTVLQCVECGRSPSPQSESPVRCVCGSYQFDLHYNPKPMTRHRMRLSTLSRTAWVKAKGKMHRLKRNLTSSYGPNTEDPCLCTRCGRVLQSSNTVNGTELCPHCSVKTLTQKGHPVPSVPWRRSGDEKKPLTKGDPFPLPMTRKRILAQRFQAMQKAREYWGEHNES